MSSHLSCIGFVFKDVDDFQARAIALAGETRERLACAAGEYAIWRSRTGAEVWFHLAPADDSGPATNIIGLAPFFEGQNHIPIQVTAAIKRPDDNPLEGFFYGWVAPESKTGTGAYPLAFEAIDFAAHASRPLPATWRCRVTGFCRNLAVHETDETLPDLGDGAQLAMQALIPIGLFNDPDQGEDEAAATAAVSMEPTALLTGIVRSHKLLRNEVTGRDFHWLEVESLAATYELVADPDIVLGEIREGAIIEAFVWMFGRVLD